MKAEIKLGLFAVGWIILAVMFMLAGAETALTMGALVIANVFVAELISHDL